jgi:hypothetical protein
VGEHDMSKPPLQLEQDSPSSATPDWYYRQIETLGKTSEPFPV